MKKQFKNMLIIVLIIVGIISVWFVKNKDNNITKIEDINAEISEDKDTEDIGNEVNEEVQEENKVEIEENIAEENKTEVEEINNGVSDVVIDKNDPNFELSTPSFDIEILKTYGLPILLDFGAKWCGPCQKMHSILEELNSELKGKAIIKYVDIDKYPESTKGFDFTLIPTQYFINTDGEIYKTHTGIISKENAISILKEMGMEE